jgi:hypothetical protein
MTLFSRYRAANGSGKIKFPQAGLVEAVGAPKRERGCGNAFLAFPLSPLSNRRQIRLRT